MAVEFEVSIIGRLSEKKASKMAPLFRRGLVDAMYTEATGLFKFTERKPSRFQTIDVHLKDDIYSSEMKDLLEACGKDERLK